MTIGTEQVDTWLSEVEHATRGVVLLQTRSVLQDRVRLLQLFEAAKRKHPLVCVNVVGCGYDFAKVKPLLNALPTELSQAGMATLRIELENSGYGVGQLSSSLTHAVPNAISVFFDPAAGDAMVAELGFRRGEDYAWRSFSQRGTPRITPRATPKGSPQISRSPSAKRLDLSPGGVPLKSGPGGSNGNTPPRADGLPPRSPARGLAPSP